MKIQGFEIDVYNQYGLKDGVTSSTCPVCSKDRKKSTQKCLSVFWDTGLAQCNHCGELLQLHTYKKKKTNDKNYRRPEWKNNTGFSNKFVKYFENKRKIKQETIKKNNLISEGITYMPEAKKERNTIQFNYWRDNELINIKYRDGEEKYKLEANCELILWNLDSIRTSKEAVITEGEFDTLAYLQAGINTVVSVPNGASEKNPNLKYIDNCIEWLENKEKIYLALDNDDPGKVTTKELIRRLGAEKCYIVDFKDVKDANDYLKKYGELLLAETLKDAKQAPLENVITLNDVKDDLIGFYRHGMPQGYKIGLKAFDDYFSTYTKQYIVITGIPSHGKTHFADQMAVGYNIMNKWKVAYCSVESEPKVLHLDAICRKIFGKKFTEIDYNQKTKELKQVTEYVNDNFFFIDYDDGYDLEKVLSKAAELVTRKGIRLLVIDPYNKIRLKRSINKGFTEYATDYLNEIEDFCRKYDALILLVAHPKKPQGINVKEYEPGFYDIKGGGEFYDMSPHGLCVHRDFVRGLVKVKVLKQKFKNLGETGKEIWFKWSKDSTRFDPLIRQPNDIEDIPDVLFTDNNLLNLNQSQETQSNTNDIKQQISTSKEFENDSGMPEQLKDSELPF